MASRPAVEQLVNGLSSLVDGPRILLDVVTCGVRAVRPLAELLRGHSVSVFQPRMLAADALGMIGGPVALEALVAGLHDSMTRRLDPVLRHAEDAVVDVISRQLARFPDVCATEALLEALRRHPYPGCVEALGRRGDSRVLPLLVERLHDDFSRAAAMDAIRFIGPPAEQALLSALQTSLQPFGREPPSRVAGRAAAAALLGELKCESAETALLEALSDAEAEVREAAAVALVVNYKTDQRTPIAILIDALASENWLRVDAASEALLAAGESAIAHQRRVKAEAPATPGDRRETLETKQLLGRLEGIRLGPCARKTKTDGAFLNPQPEGSCAS
jgi:HEAT repeat protein